jgi:CHAT domain-containing protein/tetratricopeptide (TPR) repeat protein
MLRVARWFLTVILSLYAVAVCFLLWRSRVSSFPAQLLEEAYREQRPVELRIGSAPHSPVRVQRGQQTSHMEHPRSLLEAEAAIARGLRKNPDDRSLLAARGQANLLEWSYEAAITDMQEALDTQPKSAAVLNGLATAYFERAEAEDRFDDYGSAFELQSRALQQSPDDLVIFFNRAITGAHLFLYKQSVEDWQRYLSLDASGEWHEEAQRHLSEVQEVVDAHDKRNKASLMTPAEFVRTVDATDSRTWEAVEPRIEEYLSTAIKEWLPAAFPVNGPRIGSPEINWALATLAVILEQRHDDTWLKDLLSKTDSNDFVHAISSLKRAVIADNADYLLGRKEAATSSKLFSLAGNPAGEIRARLEELYALRLSDAASECLAQLDKLIPIVESVKYRNLQIRVRLERYNCSSEEGDFQSTDQLVAAYNAANSSGYPVLALRILSTLAVDDLFKGKRRSGLARCRDGLSQYWSGSVTTYLGRAFYSAAGFGYQKNESWHLARATADQEIAIATRGEDPLSLAIEHTDLARASLMADEPGAAQESLDAAQAVLASTVKTDVTENYRLTVESYSALADGEAGHPQTGLARLDRIRPQLAKLANTNVAADFYGIAGELQNLAGHPEEAEKDLINAVALGEKMRRSVRSESDQVSWMREWAKPYLDLVEVEFQLGKPSEALDVWELYRDPNVQALSGSSGYEPSVTEIEISVDSMRLSLSHESERARQAFSRLDDQTVLIIGLAPHGVAIWTYDNRGLTARWLQKNPADIRLQSQQLAELCAQPASSLEEIRATARQLYDALIEPVSGQLRANQTLVIQTDETLAALPFQALVNHTGQYLEDQHPVTYMPPLNEHSSEVRSYRVNSDAAALIVASSGGLSDGLRPLADAVTEARAIFKHFPRGQLLVGTQASPTAIHRQLPRAEVFHFAGHAFVGGLLLDPPDGSRKAVLFDTKVLRKMTLPKLQLAVLSACSTENGGEGLPQDFDSLARAILAQGVPHVLATRWNVDSAASETLMISFYDSLLAGASPPRALAAAEAVLRLTEPHPYYWAGFDAFGQN